MSYEIARHWRLKQQRYGLVGSTCPLCDEKIFPPRPNHPDCKSGVLVNLDFSKEGDVYDVTSLTMEASRFSR